MTTTDVVVELEREAARLEAAGDAAAAHLLRRHRERLLELADGQDDD